jgi:AcrR family transcriptional regulator
MPRQNSFHPFRAQRRAKPLSPPAHRTQDERTATARRLILEATLRCLFTGGYRAVTTVRVARQARFSRGALQHHFRNRDRMVSAAIEYLFEKAAAEFATAFSRFAPEERSEQQVVALMWTMFHEGLFPLWTQLIAASRTEPRLREALQRADEKFRAALITSVAAVFGDNASSGISALITAMLGMSFQTDFAAGQWQVDAPRYETFSLRAIRGFARAYSESYLSLAG